MRALFLEAPESLLEERRRWGLDHFDEVWEGVLHVAPPPSFNHQNFTSDLVAYLKQRWGWPQGAWVTPEIAVTPPGTPDWTKNYRAPDFTLIPAARSGIIRGTHLAGAPLVVGEVRSPGDESYEKFPFYAALGVPEVWILDRDTCEPELYELAGTEYARRAPDADGWLRSPASGVAFRWPLTRPGRLAVRVGDDPATEETLPGIP